MIRAVVLYILAICGMLAASLLPAHAGRVVADLSQSNVSITSGFHGTELLLFGAVDGRETDDIIVVVSGPPTDVAQRRKAQVGGIWINVETNIWKDAPSLYQILATRPLAEIANADILAQLQIGADQLQLQLEPEKPQPGSEKPDAGKFLQSFARNMASTGLWPADVGSVKLTDGALFRDGVVFSESETNIYIKKGGLSAMIYNFAHDYSLFYGLFAIAFAVAAGWLAAVAFRRG
jgi:uncharacterized protein (TIGR02186 family)